MKRWILGPAIILATAGCQQQPKAATASSSASVLDVAAPSAAHEPAVSTGQSQSAAPPAPVAQSPAPDSPATGASYTVKKGDTLYRIARERYGDGKKWQQIAAANPGVSPSSLRVGQVLLMP